MGNKVDKKRQKTMKGERQSKENTLSTTWTIQTLLSHLHSLQRKPQACTHQSHNIQGGTSLNNSVTTCSINHSCRGRKGWRGELDNASTTNWAMGLGRKGRVGKGETRERITLKDKGDLDNVRIVSKHPQNKHQWVEIRYIQAQEGGNEKDLAHKQVSWWMEQA